MRRISSRFHVSILLAALVWAALPAPGGTAAAGGEAFTDAAAALRRGDCDRAQGLLQALIAEGGKRGRWAQLLLGFYAHACDQTALAETLLFAAPDASGVLEDWRLYILAAAAVELEHVPVALAALERLLEEHPASPLHTRAMLELARRAHEADRDDAARTAVERARRLELGGPARAELEALAWEIAGGRLGGGDARVAATELLVHFPADAAELEVVQIFRHPSGEIPWRSFLGVDQLETRAERLLEIDLPKGALETLEAIPPAERDAGWYLMHSHALTLAHRGSDAYASLRSISSSDPDFTARLEWQRAAAARDAARTVRGRRNLPAAEREELEAAELGHLRLVAGARDADLALRALDRLHRKLADDEERYPELLDVLARIEAVSPGDSRGSSTLWSQGWRAYRDQRAERALDYWSDLERLYPETARGRAGRYWSARLRETLGEPALAQELYRSLAASDTRDFYHRHAADRLAAGTPPATTPAPAASPWPRDQHLARALLLSDLGLDELALEEVELLEAVARRPAVAAARSRILARMGRRRDSIAHLRGAFPALGGPHQKSVPRDALELYYPLDYLDLIEPLSKKRELSAALLLAMIRQESAFDPQARSWAGAVGLMQLMPATGREMARRIGLSYSSRRLADPQFSVEIGSAYFQQMMRMFDGEIELALAGYNAGPYRIRRLLREAGPGIEMDLFMEGLEVREARIYVKRVLLFADSYQNLYEAVS